jgi:hypothetical protein
VEKEVKHAPKYLRYPLFLLGLIVLAVGGLIGEMLKLTTNSFLIIAVVGFVLLMASVLIR